MEDFSSVVDKSTLTTPSDVSTVPISSEDNTIADSPISSTPVPQQKPKFSNISRKFIYFFIGSIFVFAGLSMLSEGLFFWSLVCFLIAITTFKFEVGTLIAPPQPKFSHIVLYIGYLIVASVSFIFGLLTIVGTPILGILFLLMTIIFLNFAFLWNPEEQISRSEVALKNFLKGLEKGLEKGIEQKRPKINRSRDLNPGLDTINVSGMNFFSWLTKWLKRERPKISRPRDLNATLTKIDVMEGEDFENFLKSVFENLGYSVKGTRRTGDQGADLILSKDGKKTAVQVKRYSSKVSNKAVQEVVASKALYKCTEGLVVTNNYFTNSAIELAKANSIGLIDRDELTKIIKKAYI
ncbi:hypothetical protein MSKOL_1974 [Methanosarcina sp. Kolksee]|uniref:restriction endonuclease n=1 Tax=Methanosarcina sp. Kolksee TaxID=1434099 RepID=UPI000615F088|nr:restriction endonuclease [Methanosarcina sp. Kolksee]AKB47751.1 hypothetical protein MSKOL_1974 [Methanosarcina sp. Kolksee]